MSYPPLEEFPPSEEELREVTHPVSRGLYYVIPSQIMDSNELTPLEKLAYALLSGLAHKDGTCYPSDKYLAQRLNVSPETITRLIRKLCSIGLIEKETTRHPKWKFRRSRLIIVKTSFKKVLTPVTDDGRGSVTGDVKGTVTDDGRPTVTDDGIVSKVNRVSKERVENSPKKKFSKLSQRDKEKNSPSAQTRSPSFFEFKRVKMKRADHEKLLEEHGKEQIEEMMERLDEYADLNPKRFQQYANHATVIRKWIREDVKNLSKSPINRIKQVQQWIMSNPQKETIERLVTTQKMIIGKDYIDIIGIPGGYINFTDKNSIFLIDYYLKKIESKRGTL